MPTGTYDLAATLDDLTKWINQYTVLPTPECAPTISLWVAHTYRSTDFYTSPRLSILSAVPSSGKTRVLELLDLTCHQPKMTVSATVAALFRRIGLAHRAQLLPPTILFDETDALFGSARPSESTEQLRALMNSGYKRGATIDRCEGDASQMKVVEFPVFSPLALAGLAGRLPDTIATRSIIIEMKKRTASETVKPFRERDAEAEVEHIVSAFQAWSQDEGASLRTATPTMPPGVHDRPAEVWEPLLAIADQAGGHWPETARKACKSFVFAPSTKTPPLSIELLADIRTVMGHDDDDSYTRVDSIKTADLIHHLKSLEESPWESLDHGKGLDARKLSRLLSNYGVRPVQFRDVTGKQRGYTITETQDQAGLADAWSRYLKPVNQTPATAHLAEAGTNGTSGTPQVNGPESVPEDTSLTGTATGTHPAASEPVPEPVPVHHTPNGTKISPVTSAVPDVPLVPASQSTAEAAVLEALSDTHPVHFGAVMKQVTAVTGSGTSTGDILDRLEQTGIVTQPRPSYYLRTTAKTA